MKKPAIIILHGWGLSAFRFLGLSTLLTKKGYSVFTPDFPGFGKSRIPDRPFTLLDYVDFLRSYIQKQKMDSFIIIGHSFGGRVALRYAAVQPEALRALILTGTPGFTPVARKKLFFFILLAKIGKVFFSVWPLTLLSEKIRPWYYYLVGAREFYRAEGVMRETFKLVVQEELQSAMKKVCVPTLLVWGSEDSITPIWIAKKMKEFITGSTLEIIKARDHGVSFKDPHVFVSRIEKFLAAL